LARRRIGKGEEKEDEESKFKEDVEEEEGKLSSY